MGLLSHVHSLWNPGSGSALEDQRSAALWERELASLTLPAAFLLLLRSQHSLKRDSKISCITRPKQNPEFLLFLEHMRLFCCFYFSLFSPFCFYCWENFWWAVSKLGGKGTSLSATSLGVPLWNNWIGNSNLVHFHSWVISQAGKAKSYMHQILHLAKLTFFFLFFKPTRLKDRLCQSSFWLHKV